MLALIDQPVVVLGLGPRGRAACELLQAKGARVVAVEPRANAEMNSSAEELKRAGIEVKLGVAQLPARDFALAVVSPAVPLDSELVRTARKRKIPVMGELELGFQHAQCLMIAVAGTNGKGTTGELIERMLTENHRKCILCGHQARPICSVVQRSKELDFLILQVNAFQLETTDLFRPSVAVLMNLAPDHMDRYATPTEYARASARLFLRQQMFDWAIVQSQAAATLQELKLPVPGKTITFSATDQEADLHLDRGLLVSKMANWPGPLIDIGTCQLRGPHNAENLMAALAVGHVLRLSLDEMLEPVRSYSAGRHRFELVADRDGVQFINDSKATNLDALHKALLATRAGPAGQPNIWLIAGGASEGLDFHDLGPVLSKRVRHAFLLGEATEKIRAAWSLFIPCTVSQSLLHAITEAAGQAAPGNVVLLSPACSSFDQFRNYQERGEIFCQIVKSIGGGADSGNPNMNGRIVNAG